jgi:hypothetical protein
VDPDFLIPSFFNLCLEASGAKAVSLLANPTGHFLHRSPIPGKTLQNFFGGIWINQLKVFCHHGPML